MASQNRVVATTGIRAPYLDPFRNVWPHRHLLWELIKRDLGQRYQGAYLGALWSLIVPLLMLLIYTFIFSTIFQARWGASTEELSFGEFGLTLFAGLVPYNLFVEVLTRSPGVIVGVPNYIKKVVFPLEILPIVPVSTAIINSLLSVALLLAGCLVLLGRIPATVVLLPLAYIPLILMSLAVSWLTSSLAVYVRDISQAVGVLAQILFFLSPVFYPETAVPQPFLSILALNPLTTVLTCFRRALLWDEMLPWRAWLILTVTAAMAACLAYVWFAKTKRGFADVL